MRKGKANKQKRHFSNNSAFPEGLHLLEAKCNLPLPQHNLLLFMAKSPSAPPPRAPQLLPAVGMLWPWPRGSPGPRTCRAPAAPQLLPVVGMLWPWPRGSPGPRTRRAPAALPGHFGSAPLHVLQAGKHLPLHNGPGPRTPVGFGNSRSSPETFTTPLRSCLPLRVSHRSSCWWQQLIRAKCGYLPPPTLTNAFLKAEFLTAPLRKLQTKAS